jgi:hypothetical protein
METILRVLTLCYHPAIYDDGDCENFELFDAVVKLLKAIEHKTFSEVQRAQEIPNRRFDGVVYFNSSHRWYVKIFQINRCNS